MRNITKQITEDDAGADKDMLLLFGGIALAVLGAGLILSNRHVRQLLGQIQPGALMQSAVPDIQRYLKLRAM
jgi:hypothetical protein